MSWSELGCYVHMGWNGTGLDWDGRMRNEIRNGIPCVIPCVRPARHTSAMSWKESIPALSFDLNFRGPLLPLSLSDTASQYVGTYVSRLYSRRIQRVRETCVGGAGAGRVGPRPELTALPPPCVFPSSDPLCLLAPIPSTY